MHWKTAIEDFLTGKSGKPVQISSAYAVGGGSINSAYGLETNVGNGEIFCQTQFSIALSRNV